MSDNANQTSPHDESACYINALVAGATKTIKQTTPTPPSGKIRVNSACSSNSDLQYPLNTVCICDPGPIQEADILEYMKSIDHALEHTSHNSNVNCDAVVAVFIDGFVCREYLDNWETVDLPQEHFQVDAE